MNRSSKVPLRRPIVSAGDHHEAARWRRFRQDGHLFVRRQGREEDGRKFLYWECGACGSVKDPRRRAFGSSPEKMFVIFEDVDYAPGAIRCSELVMRAVLRS